MKKNTNDGFVLEAKKINECHARVIQHSKDALLAARDAGEQLVSVRDRYRAIWVRGSHKGKGKGFKYWIEKNCKLRRPQAYGYIKIFERWEEVKHCESIQEALVYFWKKYGVGKRKDYAFNGKFGFRTRLFRLIHSEFKTWTDAERIALCNRPELLRYMVEELRKAVQPPVFSKAA